MKKELGDEQQFRWHFAALYVCNAISPLPPDMKLKLSHLAEQYGGDSTWEELVEAEFDLDQPMVREIHAACTSSWDSFTSLVFILRGLGCPEPEECIRSVFGA